MKQRRVSGNMREEQSRNWLERMENHRSYTYEIVIVKDD